MVAEIQRVSRGAPNQLRIETTITRGVPEAVMAEESRDFCG